MSTFTISTQSSQAFIDAHYDYHNSLKKTFDVSVLPRFSFPLNTVNHPSVAIPFLISFELTITTAF